MTRGNSTLRIGAVSLLAGSLIFTSFQTFAESFNEDPFAWGEVQETVSVVDAPIENEEIPSVSIIADSTTENSFWTDISTTPTTETSVDDNASWILEGSIPSTDQAAETAIETHTNMSWTQGPLESTETGNPPIVENVCEALHTPLSIWYNDMGISIYNDLQLCLRNVDLPCRGGQCSIQYFLRQGCYQQERDAVAALDKTYCERWQSIKYLCPNTRSWCDM